MLGAPVPTLIINFATLWAQFAVPTEYSEFVMGAMGNHTTCSASAFLFQFRSVFPGYYCALAFWARHRIWSKFSKEVDY